MIQWEVKERKELAESAASFTIIKSTVKPEFSGEAEILHQEILACIKDEKALDLGSLSGSAGDGGAITPKVKLYGLGEPQYLSFTTARRILSQDEFGRLLKENECGNSSVTRLGNVFFKREPEHHLQEQAVYQLSVLLGGGIVAPSQLLIVELPNEHNQIEFIAVQASLAVGRNGIEDVGLDELLLISGGIKWLKNRFGEKEFIQELPRLLSGDYYQDWLKKQNFAKPIEQLSWDEKCTLFLDRIYQLPEVSWPLEFTQDSSSRELIKRGLDDNRDLRRSLFSLLALIEQYPALRGQFLSDIFFLPALFKLLHRLYPKEAMEKIVTEGEQLFDYFNPENLTKHLVLALLTEPEDHKGDNFRVKIQRDEKRKLLPFEIVAIDNDSAMQGIIEHRKNGFELRAKSIIFSLVMLMNKPIAEKVCQHLHSLNIDLTIMRWLAGLEQYYQTYHSLSKDGIIFPAMFNMQLHLHEHIRQGFIERFSEVLQTIQCFIVKETNLQALLLNVSPILGSYYQGLLKLYTDPQALLKALYAREQPTLEKILQNYWSDIEINSRLQSIAKPVNSFHSFWQVLGGWLQKKLLLQLENKNQAEVLQILIRLSQFKNCQWKDEELCLRITTFMELFDKTRNSGCFAQFFKNFEKVWLINDKEKFLLTAPDILFQVMPLKKEPIFIEALLNCNVNVYFIREDGYLPLHFAAHFGYATYIPLLIKSEETLEALDNQKQSPLDKAIQYKHDEAIIQLLCQGAGQKLQLENGLALIKHFKKSHNELCQALLNRNQELAWQIALQNVSQEEATPEQVFLEGFRGQRYLRSEIYAQIFSGGTFTRENVYGRHKVKPITIQLIPGLSSSMHLKENPEFPGREIMVHYLAHKLFGFITPPVSLWRFSKMEGWVRKVSIAYPILASLTIQGPNLLQALEEPDFLRKLDQQSFSESVVLAMLINPEDGRGDNYIVQGNRIISIDNDRSFVRPIALKMNGEEIEGPKGLQVKTILYCLDLMQEIIHPSVRERLLTINSYDFLKEWLEHLQQEQIRIQKIFSDKERKRLFENNIQLDILFKPSVIADIYQKLMRLQNTLRHHPEMPLLQILRRVIPELGLRYTAAFEAQNTPLKRFNTLTEGCFAIQQIKIQNKTKDYYPSIAMSSAKMMELTQDKRLEAKFLEEEQAATLDIALVKLSKIHKQYLELNAIQQELLAGKPERFQGLIPDQQEMIVNGKGADLPGIDFAKIIKADRSVDINAQRKVWTIIQKGSFRKLRILNYAVLTDDELGNILRLNKGLLALELLGCIQVTDRAIAQISKDCPTLEKLKLDRLPLLSLGPNFSNLRKLIVRDCPNLKEWSHQGVSIEWLEFQACQRLAVIRIASSINVKRVILSGCIVPHSQFYEKFPQLIQLYFGGLPNDFIQALGKMLAKGVFLKMGNKIPIPIVDKLTEMAELWRNCVRKIIPILLVRLEDENIDIRIAAADALGKLSPPPEVLKIVMDVLMPLLKHENPEIRRTVVDALGKLSIPRKRFKELIDALVPLLVDLNIDVRRAAANALEKLSIPPEMLNEVIGTLVSLLKNQDIYARNDAAYVLGKLSIPSEMLNEVIDTLVSLLKDKYSYVRSDAADALEKLSISTERSMMLIDTLVLLLEDWDPDVRRAAANVLGKLSPTPEVLKIVIGTIISLLKDENPEVRKNAAHTFGKLSIPPGILNEVIDILVPLLKAKDSWVRSSATDALGELSIPGEILKGIIDALLPLLKDEDSHVRISAAHALGKLPPLPKMLKEIIDALMPLLKDWASDAIRAAVGTLMKLSNSPEILKETINALLLLLKDWDPDVRRNAACALGKLSIPEEMLNGAIDILVTSLKKNLEDTALGKLLHTPQTIKTIMNLLFLELNKPVALQNKNYVTSISTSLAELCQVDHFMNCFATWFENTFPKASEEPSQTPASTLPLPSSASLSLTKVALSLSSSDHSHPHPPVHHHTDHNAQIPLPRSHHSPGDSKEGSETHMLQQFTLAYSQQTHDQDLQASHTTTPQNRIQKKL